MGAILALQNQALDILLVIVWASAIAWGIYTGAIRQVIALAAACLAPITAAALQWPLGGFIAAVMSSANSGVPDLVAYALAYVVVLAGLVLVFWRAYPHTRLRGHRRLDATLGGIIGGLWMALVVVFCVSMARAYTDAFLPPAQHFNQQRVLDMVQSSSAIPFLQLVLSPVWSAISSWFPQGAPSNIAG